MARYLITGIAGFIGSSLARELLRLGHEVRGVDNLSTGTMENLMPILEDLDFREMDVNDTEQMRVVCRGVDCVLHQAALASVPRSVKDPQGSHIANIDGTLSVLIAARDANVQRFVYAASSSAYGNQPLQPKHEGMVPAPLSPYAVQKLAGEHYVRSFWESYGMEGVSLRYFNVFGPRQAANSPYSGVIARFITDMLQGEVPTILGDGVQSRDFTSIDNVVCANLLASTAEAKNVAGEVFNVGSGCSQTLNALYTAIADLLRFPVLPRYGPARAGDILHSQASITKARQLLGYSPQVKFSRGLKATVEWYLERQVEREARTLVRPVGSPEPALVS